MRFPLMLTPVAALAALVLAAPGCGDDDSSSASADANQGLPQGSEPVELNPAEFTVDIDNPYWPMRVGNRWVYDEIDGETGETQRVVVTVLDRTKRIANGVEARVVRDVVSDRNGDPVEITDDWYAQDAEGNVWYLGEDTAEYENGRITTRAGSFEAGVDGAQAGIIMPANPEPGLSYRQEYYEGEAEDRAQVLSTAEQVEVPTGHYTGALLTKDLVPLEPDVQELKFYARGVGPVLTLKVSGGNDREELVSFERGR
jgi:hypothetical protein